MARHRVGIWLVGARGSVATASIVGLVALQKGWTGDVGLVSRLPVFQHLPLSPWQDFCVAGHDIRATSLVESASQLSADRGALDPQLVKRCQRELTAIDRRICQGTVLHVGETIADLAAPEVRRRRESPWEAVRRLQADMQQFVKQEQLKQLVVVHLASTEPPFDLGQLPATWPDMERMLQKRATQRLSLPASSLYAIAALDLGYPYINFTPSLGAAPPAIQQLAQLRETCHMGCDGKTGETLVKTVLAPMFANRHLDVMSWVGHNIFGNMDARVLDDPQNKSSKVVTKDRVLGSILGYAPQTLVSIENIASLGDWKTAWDHIHFRGFLGTPMTMQFVWQGCDSLLAAPLVLDLVRFTWYAWQRGDRGLLTFLASFFKHPLGVAEHDFGRQFQMLAEWAQRSTV